MLAEQGYRPERYFCSIRAAIVLGIGWPPSAKHRFWRSADMNFTGDRAYSICRYFSPADIVVDGLFGSDSANHSHQEVSVNWSKYINDSSAQIVSIDVPSELFGDWNPNSVHRNIIHATVTMAVQFPSSAFMMQDNAELVGEWKVIDIGFEPKCHTAHSGAFYLVERQDVKRILKPRALVQL